MSFEQEIHQRVDIISRNAELKGAAQAFMQASLEPKYSYNFSWLGRPIIQYPQDMVAMQELIWQVKPDLIIETGIAHGGSLILSASLLAMLDMCDAIENQTRLDAVRSSRKVLGIDIDIRAHNRAAIEAHPMASRIQMIEGSSIDDGVIGQVRSIAANYEKILVCLDSNHTHDHVLAELKAYAPLVSKGSYCVVFDTIIEDMPSALFLDRPWDKGDNAKTAAIRYLQLLNDEQVLGADGLALNFRVDKLIENKLLLTVAPDGYLQRV